MKIVKKLLKALLYLVIALLVWVAVGVGALCVNEKLDDKVALTKYTVTDPKIPDGFDGYKIMFISDLHAAPFKDQIDAHMKKQNPDALVFTGDMVQLPDDNIHEAADIALAAGDIPKFAVSGNHERQQDNYEDIMGTLKALGEVELLENDSAYLESNGDKILIAGVKDPKDDVVSEERIEKMRGEIAEELDGNEHDYSILLSHRADLYPELKDTGVDLILSGHLHGGIIRLPFVGGVVGQEGTADLFPDYDYGYFKEDDCAAMVVSGGCDKNPAKKRYFDPPEVVLITLKSE